MASKNVVQSRPPRKVRTAILSFTVQLEPGELKTFTVEPIQGGRFRARRLQLAGARRQYEMIRPWRRKGWINRLVVYGPPVDIEDLRVDAIRILAPVAIPALMFSGEESPGFNAPPAIMFTLTVRSVSERPYTLRGALIGEVLS
jgi:hypothetical protein